MTTPLESILEEAISFEARALDADQDISRADFVEWFAEWRRRARAVVQANRCTPTVAICGQQFRSQLIGALHALQIMQDRAEIEGPRTNQLTHHDRYLPPTDAEIEELIHAINNGGIQITAGPFKAMVFKRSAKESSCQRR